VVVFFFEGITCRCKGTGFSLSDFSDFSDLVTDYPLYFASFLLLLILRRW